MKNKKLDILTEPFRAISEFNEIGGTEKKLRPINSEDISLQYNLLEEEMDEIKTGMQNQDIVEVLDGCADLIVIASGMVHKLGYDTEDIMGIINECNFSKFCYNQDDAEKSVEAYKGDDRYSDVHWKKVKGVYVIYGKKPGSDSYKILKGIHTKKPDPQLLELVKEKFNLDQEV